MSRADSSTSSLRTITLTFLAIAEEELVKRPAFQCAQIRKGIPESHSTIFWAQLSIDHLKYMQEKKIPTQEKAESCLVSQNSDLTAQEDTTYYYLQEFISSLNENPTVCHRVGPCHRVGLSAVQVNSDVQRYNCNKHFGAVLDIYQYTQYTLMLHSVGKSLSCAIL